MRALVELGAPIEAEDRRGARPLHEAAVGSPGSARWDPYAQAETIRVLLGAGADPNAMDRSGTAPIHKAVRSRCAAAVEALIEGGADPRLKTKRGSTPARLAQVSSGRSGSGSAAAKAEQAAIARILEAA